MVTWRISLFLLSSCVISCYQAILLFNLFVHRLQKVSGILCCFEVCLNNVAPSFVSVWEILPNIQSLALSTYMHCKLMFFLTNVDLSVMLCKVNSESNNGEKSAMTRFHVFFNAKIDSSISILPLKFQLLFKIACFQL